MAVLLVPHYHGPLGGLSYGCFRAVRRYNRAASGAHFPLAALVVSESRVLRTIEEHVQRLARRKSPVHRVFRTMARPIPEGHHQIRVGHDVSITYKASLHAMLAPVGLVNRYRHAIFPCKPFGFSVRPTRATRHKLYCRSLFAGRLHKALKISMDQSEVPEAAAPYDCNPHGVLACASAQMPSVLFA